MVKITIVPATIQHLNEVKDDFKSIDNKECYLISGRTPSEVIAEEISQKNSVTVALADGVPVAFWGFKQMNWLLQSATPWLLATKHINKCKKSFVQASKRYFNQFTNRYKYLENYVLAENIWSIRWLKWLGFSVDKPKDIKGFQWRRFHMCIN
jgi:hypothetical protein